ncbi:PROTEIN DETOXIFICATION 31 [Salix purpurea]|uniref:PROTEIN DETOXIFICATION 31 n=1 Tax=Salix purpurea TaxID=77065 RepID=A0A9Q0U906_SALPP|nr:PROTEIN DETOXIFICATION 31 [Salix purpurea]
MLIYFSTNHLALQHQHINAAISVRVSNELGAAHPRTARFSLVVATLASLLIGLVIALALVLARNHYPDLFTNDARVKELVKELTPLLAACVIINNVQPALSGVAIGAGWQAAVAYVNIGCDYIFGIPLGLILGYKLQMGVQGIWIGMLTGTVVQTGVLFWMIGKTNWSKEASAAEERIRKWGGDDDSKNKKSEQ